MLGVNDRADLGLVQQLMNARIVNDHQLTGVTVIDPDSTWIEAAVQIGEDTVIEPGTYLRGATDDRQRRDDRPGQHDRPLRDRRRRDGRALLSGPGEGRRDASVGPFAYLRPDAELAEGAKVGTFVEIKNSKIGPGAKVPHLSYIGDADVGEGANLGAATITANYDGKNKHRTTIGDGRAHRRGHNACRSGDCRRRCLHWSRKRDYQGRAGRRPGGGPRPTEDHRGLRAAQRK